MSEKGLHDYLIAKTDGKSPDENIIVSGNTRVSVILPGLIRIEHGKSESAFTDSATQSVWFRNHGKVKYTFEITGNKIIIITDEAEFSVNRSNGTPNYAKVHNCVSRCDNGGNLKGTARTLDQTFGPIPLKDGVVSRDGAAVVDDSESLLLNSDGIIEPRRESERDIYVFAYGNNYIEAVRALYKISGEVPLVPRFVLGNWWSRYRAYTQDEYERLMLEFRRKNIPLTVATVDMDWHWVDLKKQFPEFQEKKNGISVFGNGWTGYSWNTELFPDYKEFLNFLHKQNLKVTLNLHPASGIRSFETMYEDAAKAMGIDPKTKKPVEFDIANPEFINTYFDVAHHKYEDEGVNFWWIDWQQGKKSKIPGLDPLWALNHYHYLDRQRVGARPLILSRYAGIGSHRYPLGFSGDTAMNWKVLNFQPYFTSTASNCGYTWWSHDIGGHHFGMHNDEMYVRWIQFGAFSPIMRLHSTSNDLFGKEPWNYGWDTELIATKYLRLRHELIPYIYAMNYRTHTLGRALCEPLYYNNPEIDDAYKCRNGYMFGSEMLVCPVTKKMNPKTRNAETDVWLPEGRWTNIFTGKIYKGGKTVRVHSELNTLPVFAHEGSIIPMSLDEGNSCKNPETLKIKVFRGNNEFSLYEDDGETNNFKNGEYSTTTIKVSEENDNLTLEVFGGKEKEYLPVERKYVFEFSDVSAAEKVTVCVGDEEIPHKISFADGKVSVMTEPVAISTPVKVVLNKITVHKNKPKREAVLEIMTKLNGNNTRKSGTYSGLKRTKTDEELCSAVLRVKSAALRSELLEVIEDLYYED